MADSTAVFPPGHRITATSGVPIPAAYVKFYVAGTDTLKEVFADADLTVSLGSTVYYDSYGYSVTAEGGTTKTLVYTDTEAYKIVGYDENDNIVFSHDNVRGALVATADTASGITQEQADLRYVRNPNALSEVTVLTSGDKFGIYDASSAGNRGIDYDDFLAQLVADLETAGNIFSSGARVLFQGAPPTGWTLESGTSYNDAALKFTTGTPGTGGSVAFSTLFDSQTFTGTVEGDTPSTTKMAVHTHPYTAGFLNTAPAGTDNGYFAQNRHSTASFTTSSSGSGSDHDHGLTMDAFDMTVKFVSVNIGVRD